MPKSSLPLRAVTLLAIATRERVKMLSGAVGKLAAAQP